MPWHIVRDHSDCSSGKPYAVVKDSDGSVEGCHATRDGAEAQMAALYANEPDAEESIVSVFEEITRRVFQDEADCPPGHHTMPSGECMPDEEMAVESSVEASSADGASGSHLHVEMRSPAKPGKPNPGTKKDKRLKENEPAQADAVLAFDTGEPLQPATLEIPEGTVPWKGPMVVEDERTGDGRQFAAGSLTWPDPVEVNMALQWQKETSHGGMNDVTVNVGRITQVWRDGDSVWGRGYVDVASEDGEEIARRLRLHEKLGVSIVADDPENEEVELVYPEGCSDGGIPFDLDQLLEADPKCFFPETTIFHSGRVRALTAVDVPAFVGAWISLDEDAAETPLVAGAVGSHLTETSDGAWDAGANEKRLSSPLTVAKARAAYAWLDEGETEDGELPKSAAKFLHHEVGSDGSIGAANLTACSAGIGVIHGGRGGTTIPAGDKRGVYNHLAKHLRDGGQEPPPFSTADEIGDLVAAAHLITIPDVPPAGWFTEPADQPAIGALTITDEGRIYGYLAPRGVAHRGFPDKRIEVPMRNVDYDTWATRATIVAGGGRVATGPITMDCGHADPVPWVTGEIAREHYDNSCSVVATVAIGENNRGVWIAGALLHDVTPSQVARMLACQLSGDWRPHREQPGMREFCGALLVPSPGFPMANPRFSVRLDHGQLVASTVPVHWSNNIYREVDLPTWDEVKARLDRQASAASQEEIANATELARELGMLG